MLVIRLIERPGTKALIINTHEIPNTSPDKTQTPATEVFTSLNSLDQKIGQMKFCYEVDQVKMIIHPFYSCPFFRSISKH